MRGAWKQTGKRRLKLTAIDFEFGADGSFIGYLRWTARVRMNRASDVFRVAGPASLFMVGQDPLDPDEIPFFELQCEGVARRVPAILR